MRFYITKKFIEEKACVLARAAALAGLMLLSASPAQAYYWNYYGGGRFFGTNLLYSIPYLASPLLGLNRGPYNANPLYSASSYLNRGAQRALTAPLYYQPYYLQNYKDEEPIYDPRDRVRPVRAGNLTQDQIVHASWKQGNNVDPFYAPVPGQPPYTGQPTGQSQTLPPVAPPIAARPANSTQHQKSFDFRNPTTTPAPIADGFISTVVEQHDGNLANALADPSTRSWAKALGLTPDDSAPGAEFTPTRIHLIRQILLDPSLTSVKKLDAIRILIPASANRATK